MLGDPQGSQRRDLARDGSRRGFGHARRYAPIGAG
jgi:hypothetical protein